MPGHPFSGIDVPLLPEKPRTGGITSVLDKGAGPAAVNDLCSTAGEWIDVAKLGWGTSRLYRRDVVVSKVERYRNAQITSSTGGTLLELAYAQDKVDYFLEAARGLGFDMVEVSNGIHPMSQGEKHGLVTRVSDAGFIVWSEVGRKDPREDALLTLSDRVDAIRTDLDAGASKVIVEARESGSVGIYDANGNPSLAMVERLVDDIGLERLVFEAPRKHQQVWLIETLGPSVNLANIDPADAMSVATLRTGLRGDTLAQMHLSPIDVFFETGVEGAVRSRERGGVIVVVDALRMSATVVTALARGIRSVRLVERVEECRGDVTAGERKGQKLPHVDHGNSPTELLAHDYRGKQLVLTTTNGARCLLKAASPGADVLVGSTVNCTAVAHAASRLARTKVTSITLLMAGRENRSTAEDTLAAGHILRAMRAMRLPVRLFGGPLRVSETLESDFMASESGQNLVSLGHQGDVEFCAKLDAFDAVPVFRDGCLVRLEEP